MPKYNAQETRIDTSSLEFQVLTRGSGDRDVLLLHGFPDDPGSMVPLMKRFEDRGYRAIAPYMRGYGETETPSLEPGNFSVTELARDVMSLITSLDMDQPLLVGHDWGAVAATVVSRLAPNVLSGCIAMAVPPDFLEAVNEHPRQIFNSWYMMMFQIPGFAEEVLRRDDFQLIERLYSHWSHGWRYGKRVGKVKQTFETGETVPASLRYYRDFFDEGMRTEIRGIETPTLLLAGNKDGCVSPRMFENSERCYVGKIKKEVLPNTGHFMHISDTEKVWSEITDFLDSVEV